MSLKSFIDLLNTSSFCAMFMNLPLIFRSFVGSVFLLCSIPSASVATLHTINVNNLQTKDFNGRSFSYTIPEGENQLLVVFVAGKNDLDYVRYNGVGLQKITSARWNDNGGSGGRHVVSASMYFMADPVATAGASTADIYLSSNNSSDRLAVFTLNNVYQVDPIGAVGDSGNTSAGLGSPLPPINLTLEATDSLVIGALSRFTQAAGHTLEGGDLETIIGELSNGSNWGTSGPRSLVVAQGTGGVEGSSFVSDFSHPTVDVDWQSALAVEFNAVAPYIVVPIQITGVMATAGDGWITLSWDDYPPASSFNVKRATSAVGPYTTIATVTEPTYEDQTAVYGTTYYYAISGVNDIGEGADSEAASAVTIAPVNPPGTPTNLFGTVGYVTANLSWDSLTGAATYNVKRSTTPGGPYATVANLSETTYQDTVPTGGVTYYYVVSALNSVGEGTDSAELAVVPWIPGTPQPYVLVEEDFGGGPKFHESDADLFYSFIRSKGGSSKWEASPSFKSTGLAVSDGGNGSGFLTMGDYINSYKGHRDGEFHLTVTMDITGGDWVAMGYLTRPWRHNAFHVAPFSRGVGNIRYEIEGTTFGYTIMTDNAKSGPTLTGEQTFTVVLDLTPAGGYDADANNFGTITYYVGDAATGTAFGTNILDEDVNFAAVSISKNNQTSGVFDDLSLTQWMVDYNQQPPETPAIVPPNNPNQLLNANYYFADGIWGSHYDRHSPMDYFPRPDGRPGWTYICISYTENDHPYIWQYDHLYEKWEGPVFVHSNRLELSDQHGNPNIIVDDDGYIHVFAGSHGGPDTRSATYSRSARPHDISEWVPTKLEFSHAYPRPFILSDGSICIFCRRGTTKTSGSDPWVIYRSVDRGATWQFHREIVVSMDNGFRT
ncbi:MAG: BNR-4 repeat-containing protein, partial [Verrucomicrobiota bacterium]